MFFFLGQVIWWRGSTGRFKQNNNKYGKSHFHCVIIAYSLLPLAYLYEHFSHNIFFSFSLTPIQLMDKQERQSCQYISFISTEMYTHPIPVSGVRLVWVTECSCTWDFLSPTRLRRHWVLRHSSICMFWSPHKNLLSVICISVAHDTFQDPVNS